MRDASENAKLLSFTLGGQEKLSRRRGLILTVAMFLFLLMAQPGTVAANGQSRAGDVEESLTSAEEKLRKAVRETSGRGRADIEQALESVRRAKEAHAVAALGDRRDGKAATAEERRRPPIANSIVEVALAFLTALYVAVTTALWWATKRSVRLAERMADLARSAAIANTLQQIAANDRAIKSLLVEDPSIYAALGQRIHPATGMAPEKSEAERRLAAYFGLVINHVKHVFLQEQLRQLYPNYWEAVERDISVSMRAPQFREVWKRVAPFQPAEFQRYMNEKMAAAEPAAETAAGGGEAR